MTIIRASDAAGFEEGSHPRDQGGKFSGGGGGASKSKYEERLKSGKVDPKVAEGILSHATHKMPLREKVALRATIRRGQMKTYGSRDSAAEDAHYLRSQGHDVKTYVRDAGGTSSVDPARKEYVVEHSKRDGEEASKAAQHYKDNGEQIAADDFSKAAPGRQVSGDSLNFKEPHMAKSTMSKKAAIVKGALLAALPPLLAADAQIDLDSLLKGVKRSNWLERKPGIIAAIRPSLANDEEVGKVAEMLDKMDGEEPGEKEIQEDGDPEQVETILGMLRGKLQDEDLETVRGMLMALCKPAGADEPQQTAGAANANPKDPANKEDIAGMVSKSAMDAAIKAAVSGASKDAEQKTISRLHAIAEAKEVVAPYVGKLAIAADSAEGVYKAALELLKVDVSGVHPSAYKAVLTAQPQASKRVPAAQDSATVTGSILEMFPDAQRIA